LVIFALDLLRRFRPHGQVRHIVRFINTVDNDATRETADKG
jgi:hypothetical protein